MWCADALATVVVKDLCSGKTQKQAVVTHVEGEHSVFHFSVYTESVFLVSNVVGGWRIG